MKRHSTDVVSLLFGLLFMALSAWWAVAYYLDWTVNWNVPNFGWIAAGVLIVLGLLGVMASLRRDRPEPALASTDGQMLTEDQVSADGPFSTERPVSAESLEAAEPGTRNDTDSHTVDLGPPEPPATDASNDERY